MYKKIFLNSFVERDYIKIINLHFLLLNFCSMKQKYLEKRTNFKYSKYSVHLSGMKRHLMYKKIIFLNSLNKVGYEKSINSQLSLLNFCSRKQKYLEKRTSRLGKQWLFPTAYNSGIVSLYQFLKSY